MCRRVGVWVCGGVGVWVCGCVGVWVCGCVGVWVGVVRRTWRVEVVLRVAKPVAGAAKGGAPSVEGLPDGALSTARATMLLRRRFVVERGRLYSEERTQREWRDGRRLAEEPPWPLCGDLSGQGGLSSRVRGAASGLGPSDPIRGDRGATAQEGRLDHATGPA